MKIWMGRSRAERRTVVGSEDIPGRAPHFLTPHVQPRFPVVLARTSLSPHLCFSCTFFIIPQVLCTLRLMSRCLLPPSLSILLGPHLSREAGPLGVRDVILSQVPVQPVAEVEKAVIQGQQDVSDQAWG